MTTTPGETDELTEDLVIDEPGRPVAFGWFLVVTGVIGLIAAFTLTYERIQLLKDPAYVPSCSINPVLSCGSVMKTAQAEVFGFPNPLLGLIGFSAVIAVGAALAAGGSFRRWFWLGFQGGATLGIVFIHWLIFQSLYRIGALCPYCMVVWSVTIPIFVVTTLHAAAEGHLTSSPRVQHLARTVRDYRSVVLTVWFALVVALIVIRFWDYWRTLL